MPRLVPYWSNARWWGAHLVRRGLVIPGFAVVTAKTAARVMNFSELREYRDKPDTYTFIDWRILRLSRIDFWHSSRVIKMWIGRNEALAVFDDIVIQSGLYTLHDPKYRYQEVGGYTDILNHRVDDVTIHSVEQGVSLSRVDAINLALVSLL